MRKINLNLRSNIELIFKNAGKVLDSHGNATWESDIQTAKINFIKEEFRILKDQAENMKYNLFFNHFKGE